MAIVWDDEQATLERSIVWDDEQQKPLPDMPAHAMDRPGEMQVSHDQSPGQAPMGAVERYGRKALIGAGAGIGGALATPESLGVATLPGAMVGGSIGKYAGDVIWGEREPEAEAIDYQEVEPTLPAAIARGASNENLKQSVPRFVEGALTFPYHASKAVAEPLLRGEGEQAAEGAGALAKGMVAPLGLAGGEAMREAWQKDLPGSMLFAAGGAKGGKALAKKGLHAGVKVAGKIPGLQPEQMMARHLKQSTKLSIDERARNVDTALTGEYTGNKRGLDKLYEDIDGINQEIASAINEGKNAGKAVDVEKILKPLNELRQRAMDDPIDYAEILNDIDQIEQNIRNHPTASTGKIPVDAAQRMKVEMYRNLRKQYGEMKGTYIEAKKALARGIKEQLVETIPELAKLNKKDSVLLGLEKELFRAANRIGNRDLIGIGVPIKYIAMSMHKSKLAMATGVLLGMMDTPAVQGRLAILLRRAKDRPLFPGELSAFMASLKERSRQDVDEVAERGLVPVKGEGSYERVAPINELPSGPTIAAEGGPITDPRRLLVNPHQLPNSPLEVTSEGTVFKRSKFNRPANDVGMTEQAAPVATEPTGTPGARSVGGDYDALAQGRKQLPEPAFEVSPGGTAYKREAVLPNTPDVGLLEQNPVGVSQARAKPKLYDVTSVAQMLKDQVDKDGLKKTAAKYGVPVAIVTAIIYGKDSKEEAAARLFKARPDLLNP